MTAPTQSPTQYDLRNELQRPVIADLLGQHHLQRFVDPRAERFLRSLLARPALVAR